jgi:hypothetical protein
MKSMGWPVQTMVLAACLLMARMATAADAPIRVVVWDEQQPSQKEAYDTFLGNCIADHLRAQPGFDVRSLSLNDAEQGLSKEILDFAEVMFWWGHQKQAAVKPEVGKAIVERVKADRETFERLLPRFEENPRIILSRLWEDARERILTGDVETFYTAPGRLELQLNRDPQVQQERQKQQVKSLKEAQAEFRR